MTLNITHTYFPDGDRMRYTHEEAKQVWFLQKVWHSKKDDIKHKKC